MRFAYRTRPHLALVYAPQFVLLLVLLTLLLAHVADAQNAATQTPTQTVASGPPPREPGWVPRPVRDQKSIDVVQASLTALGGAAAIGQVQSCIVQAAIQAAPNSVNQSGNMAWEVSGAESKTTFTSSQGSIVQASGHGQPFRVVNGTSQSIPWHILRASFFPPLANLALAIEFQDPNYSLQYQGTATVGSDEVTIIRISSQSTFLDTQVTPQIWYFSNATNLPVQVSTRLPNSQYPGKFVLATVNLSTYQSVSGVLYPFQVALSINGNPVNVVNVSSIGPNASIPPSDFDPATGGAQ